MVIGFRSTYQFGTEFDPAGDNVVYLFCKVKVTLEGWSLVGWV